MLQIIMAKKHIDYSIYDKKFELLWRKLQKEKLVKHSLEEIENSDLFKYSPYKELNDNQRNAVETIIQKIREENTNRIVINGMPRSGKTIVAVYLMKYLTDCEEFKNKQIGFVVPQTSLRKTMISYWWMKHIVCISIKIYLIWVRLRKIVKNLD